MVILMVFSIISIAQMQEQPEEQAGMPLSYDPVYSDIIRKEPIYNVIKVDYEYSCYKGGAMNTTCIGKTDDYVFAGYRNVILGVKLIEITVNKEAVEGFLIYDTGSQLKDIPKYIVWDYDIGDRNMKEFGRCRKYEIEKGVCDEIY